jgi:hypothetical protein
MKQKRIASSLYILLGIVLGMIPPVAYHLITTQHPPAPASLWDSRPCRMDPGPLTCDNILPRAPSDFQALAHGKIPGDSACIDQKSKQYQSHLKEQHGNSQFGTITLWWLPSCQSAFAETSFISDDGNIPMSAQLVVTPPGNRWTNEQQRTTTTTAQGIEFDGYDIWTTLVWIHPGASVAACGFATSVKITYSACTPAYQLG